MCSVVSDLCLSQSHLSQSHLSLSQMFEMSISFVVIIKKLPNTDNIRSLMKIYQYCYIYVQNAFHIWENKNVNKAQCFSSETVPIWKFFFRNGNKILPKRITNNFDLIFRLPVQHIHYKVVPAAPENTS